MTVKAYAIRKAYQPSAKMPASELRAKMQLTLLDSAGSCLIWVQLNYFSNWNTVLADRTAACTVMHHPRTKHEVDWMTSRWDMAIWSFPNGRRPPSWIWSNRKWRRSIGRHGVPENPTLEPNMKGIGW